MAFITVHSRDDAGRTGELLINTAYVVAVEKEYTSAGEQFACVALNNKNFSGEIVHIACTESYEQAVALVLHAQYGEEAFQQRLLTTIDQCRRLLESFRARLTP